MGFTTPSSYAVLSIAAAIMTIGLKFAGFYITGSVGLFSDAIESLVNLVTAVTAFALLRVAERPADANHMYGHTKAEYFSSVTEGVCILIAAGGIAYAAGTRIIHPSPLEQPVLGIGISGAASLINLAVALILSKAGKKFRSITLEADSHHLMTDVWTSIAVIIGIIAVYVTGIQILDPVIAILVSLNIVSSGYRIIRQSVAGFMDTSINQEDIRQIEAILDTYAGRGISFHGLRTRQSASRRFVTFHILVPGKWSVRKAHNLSEIIERDIRTRFEKMTVTTHLEPREDPRSNTDITIDRE